MVVKVKYTVGVESASRLRAMSSGVFLAFFVIVYMIHAVTEGFAVPVLLCCYELMSSKDFFKLLLIIVLGVVDLSGLAEKLLPGHQEL